MNKRPVGPLVFFFSRTLKITLFICSTKSLLAIFFVRSLKILDSIPGNPLKVRSHYYRWRQNIVRVSLLPFPWSKRERARGRQEEKERPRKRGWKLQLPCSNLGRKSSNADDYATSVVKESTEAKTISRLQEDNMQLMSARTILWKLGLSPLITEPYKRDHNPHRPVPSSD